MIHVNKGLIERSILIHTMAWLVNSGLIIILCVGEDGDMVSIIMIDELLVVTDVDEGEYTTFCIVFTNIWLLSIAVVGVK